MGKTTGGSQLLDPVVFYIRLRLKSFFPRHIGKNARSFLIKSVFDF